jgi:DNA transposition AAA+ family ATPase
MTRSKLSLGQIADLLTETLKECERSQRSDEARHVGWQRFENAHAVKYGNGIALFLTGLPRHNDLLRKAEALVYLEWLESGNFGFPGEMKNTGRT